jgi:DNA-binding MarR family transcriptional regulator
MAKNKEKIKVEPPVGLWMLMRRTIRLIGKARQRELLKCGISDDASAVLLTVWTLGRQAIPAMISRYLFLERHSVSQLLTRMEKDGLVQRVKDLERRNYVRVELTKKGLDAFHRSSRQRSTKPIMTVLTDKEQEALWSILARLRERTIKRLGMKDPILFPPPSRQDIVLNAANAPGKKTILIEAPVALWILLRRTSHLMGKARQRELAKYGISVDASAAIFTIMLLGRQAIPATISRNLYLERHSVSQLLTRLEKDNLVRRVKDLERKNYVRVELTEKGKDAYRKASKNRSTKQIISILSEEEQRQMWVLLAKLRDRALKRLDIRKPILFPPSDYSQLSEGQ